MKLMNEKQAKLKIMLLFLFYEKINDSNGHQNKEKRAVVLHQEFLSANKLALLVN